MCDASPVINVMYFLGKSARDGFKNGIQRQLEQMNKPLIEAQGTNKATTVAIVSTPKYDEPLGKH